MSSLAGQTHRAPLERNQLDSRKTINMVLLREPTSSGCPANRLFVQSLRLCFLCLSVTLNDRNCLVGICNTNRNINVLEINERRFE